MSITTNLTDPIGSGTVVYPVLFSMHGGGVLVEVYATMDSALEREAELLQGGWDDVSIREQEVRA